MSGAAGQALLARDALLLPACPQEEAALDTLEGEGEGEEDPVRRRTLQRTSRPQHACCTPSSSSGGLASATLPLQLSGNSPAVLDPF